MNNPCEKCLNRERESAFGISEWTLEKCQEVCFAHKDYHNWHLGYQEGLAQAESKYQQAFATIRNAVYESWGAERILKLIEDLVQTQPEAESKVRQREIVEWLIDTSLSEHCYRYTPEELEAWLRGGE